MRRSGFKLYRLKLYQLLTRKWYNKLITLISLAHCLLIFWEEPLEITVPADAGWGEGWKVQLIIEMFFVAFYLLDLALNIIASRTLYIHSARGALACGNPVMQHSSIYTKARLQKTLSNGTKLLCFA